MSRIARAAGAKTSTCTAKGAWLMPRTACTGHLYRLTPAPDFLPVLAWTVLGVRWWCRCGGLLNCCSRGLCSDSAKGNGTRTGLPAGCSPPPEHLTASRHITLNRLRHPCPGSPQHFLTWAWLHVPGRLRTAMLLMRRSAARSRQ